VTPRRASAPGAALADHSAIATCCNSSIYQTLRSVIAAVATQADLPVRHSDQRLRMSTMNDVATPRRSGLQNLSFAQRRVPWR
jgi:hypothetical protein